MQTKTRQHTAKASKGKVKTASLISVASFLLVALQLLIAPPANAASLQVVPGSQWGSAGLNTTVEMSIYVPDNVVANPPVLVAMHSCGGSGPFFFYDSESNVWADKYGFIVIAPSTVGSDGKYGRCWDNGSPESLTRYGRADSEAVIRMVKYTLDKYHANPNRVYALGGSSGAMMVETMLGVYPEVFKAGVGFAGVTCGANGWWDGRDLNPQQWGDIVRAINPGYSGPYPRIQLWHGTADPTVSYQNLVNSAKQYSNLLGLRETPTSKTEEHLLNVQNTFIHQVWQNACGDTLIDAYSEVGGNHGSAAWKPVFWGPFLGLNVVGPNDPIMPCDGSCKPTALTPYVQVKGDSWQQTASVTVTSGDQVTFGPQPLGNGAWSWSGCGTSGSSREQTIFPTGSCTATATYTNSCGAQSAQQFAVKVDSTPAPTPTPTAAPMLHVEGRYLKNPDGQIVNLRGGWMQPTETWFNGGGRWYSNPSDWTNPSNVAGMLNFMNGAADLMSDTSPRYGKSHGWYATFVRVNTDAIGGWTQEAGLVDRTQFNAWIQNFVVPYANHLKSRGLYLVLSATGPINTPNNGSHNAGRTEQARLRTFWSTVANAPGVKNADNIMFELMNEPVDIESSPGNGDWGHAQAKYFSAFKNWIQPVIDDIRNTGANNVIWVPTLEWQGSPQEHAQYPFTCTNCGVAAHYYPAYGGCYDNVDCHNRLWNSNYKPAADRWPMIITENFWFPEDTPNGLAAGSTDKYGKTLKANIDAAGNVSYMIGFLGDLLANLNDAPPANANLSSKQGAQAAFEWWYQYSQSSQGNQGNSCAPTTITPYAQVNDGSWQQASNVTVNPGDKVKLGPQPVSGGSWAWSGGGTSGSAREQTVSATSSTTAKATYTNDCGATSSQDFSIAVNGSGSSGSSGGGSSGGGSSTGAGDAIVHLTKRNARGFAIDGNNGGTAGQKVYLWTSDGNNANQAWVEIDRGQGFYSYKKVNTDVCLDGGNGGANAQNVILWSCDANNQNQQWQKIDAGSGNYRLQKRNAPGYSIDGGNGGADGQSLYLWASDGNNQNQQWTFDAGSASSSGVTAVLSGHVYKLQNANSGKVLAVAGMSGDDGAHAMQWSDSGTRDHEWRIDLQANGYYKLTNQNSGKVLGILDGATADGGEVIQWGDNGTEDHDWKLVASTGGSYKLLNRHSGKVLGIQSRSKSDGALALQWADNGTADHNWKFVEVAGNGGSNGGSNGGGQTGDAATDGLKNLAPFPVGVAVNAGGEGNSIVSSGTSGQQQAVVFKHFDQLTAGNIMKMSYLHPSEGTFTFGQADELISLARSHGLDVHGHTLIWHADYQVPGFMKSYGGNFADMLKNHVQTIVRHFQGRVVSWDVVNEALADDGEGTVGNGLRSTVFSQKMGLNFIDESFRNARAADSNVDLFYNDYNCEANGQKTRNLLALVDGMRSRGVPITGVGFQMHVSIDWPSIDAIETSLRAVASRGLKVKISELDVSMRSAYSSLTGEAAARQKQRYHDIVAAYIRAVPAAQRAGITVWGVWDSDSWINQPGKPDWPLLFDANFQAKPALQGFGDALLGR